MFRWSHLSGYLPKFWEVVETHEWWFYSYISAAWVVWTVKDGGDTPTLIAVKKHFEPFVLSSGRDIKTSATSPHTQALALQLQPSAHIHTCAQQATWFHFHNFFY